VSRLVSSSRFRRRAAWLGVCVAVAGVVVFLGVHFSNTGHKFTQTFEAGKTAQLVPKSPKRQPFTAVEQKQVRAVAVQFIESAVYRNHVDRSWTITTSGLHQGLSRSDWATGAIPIVPYPKTAVETVRWRLNYSIADEVGMKVAFFPKPTARVERQVFDISLQNRGTAASPRWLVSYWAPSGGVQISQGDPRVPAIATNPPKPELGAVWLFVPVGIIIGGLVGIVVFLLVRARIRHVRAMKHYKSRTYPS
jgi:hypothetical protein